MRRVEITHEDPRAEDVRALLQRHLEFANAHSPAEDVHALDVVALLDPAVTFFAARCDGRLLGVGALKVLGEGHAELKSMHTAAHARGQGVGRSLVRHLSAVARERGIGRLSLETGTVPAFAPARSLYASEGFTSCPPFGSYRESGNSTFMTMLLS